jgi:hypothetical protein
MMGKPLVPTSMTALGKPPGTLVTPMAADGEKLLQSLDTDPTDPEHGSYSASPTKVWLGMVVIAL